MRKIHWPHVLIVEILDWEVGEHSSICKPVPCDVDFSPTLFKVNIVLSPLLLPFFCLESNGEGSCHLDSNACWKVRGGFVVKESEDLAFCVN